MATYFVTLTDAEDKALHTVAVDGNEWITNAVKERCRIAMEEIIHQEVQRKLAAGEPITGTKEDIVLSAPTVPLKELDRQRRAAMLREFALVANNTEGQ